MISISHKFRLIYLHIPKTGGSSANRWLESLDPNTENLGNRPHEPISYICKHHPIEFSNYFIFSIVRNPWARAVSLYHYRKKNTDHQPPHWPSRADINSLSFREVVIKSLDQNPKYSEICPPRDAPETAWLEPSCFAWLSIEDQIAVDAICKLESIHEDISAISKKLGFEATAFPHMNQSDHRHYKDYYDEETKNIVANRYSTDIEHFGYSFEE